MVRRAETGAALGAAKCCGGGKALTGTGVLPQTNAGDASQQDARAACPGTRQLPPSGMRLVHQAVGCSMSQAQALSTGTASAVLRGSIAKEPVSTICLVLASTERGWEEGEASV